jgi:hypothetical protein
MFGARHAKAASQSHDAGSLMRFTEATFTGTAPTRDAATFPRVGIDYPIQFGGNEDCRWLLGCDMAAEINEKLFRALALMALFCREERVTSALNRTIPVESSISSAA